MPRRSARDGDPEVMRLFDKFVHGDNSRREFLDRVAAFAVAGVVAKPVSTTGLITTKAPRTASTHGFKNDTTPRFDADSGERISRRTMDFLARHLS